MHKKTYPADEAMGRAYDEYYRLVKAGKTEQAEKRLNALQKSFSQGFFFCPFCSARLVKSDMPKKDFVCLPCDKYFSRDELRKMMLEHDERIQRITDDFIKMLERGDLRVVPDNATNRVVWEQSNDTMQGDIAWHNE